MSTSLNRTQLMPLALVAALMGCDGDITDTDPGTDTDFGTDTDADTQVTTTGSNYTDGLTASPDFSAPSSLIAVTAFVEFGSLSLYAQFADGPTPRVHTQSDIEGSCRIVSYTPSQCRTDCGSDALCVDGECQDYPSRNSPGTLQLEWADGSATIEPNGIGQYSHSDSTDVHGEMTVQVDGMTLTNPSMQPPTPVGDWGEALTERGNDDGELTWSDPIEGARIRLRMTDCTGSHGGLSDNEIECEGPDTGMLTIPAGFLDLLDDGNWNRGECGSHYVERYVASSPADDDATRFESIARVHLFYRGDGQ